MVSVVVISMIMVAFLFPLVHFDFSLQSIAVWNFDSEIFVFNFFWVYCCASHVCQFKIVCVVWVFAVKSFDCFLSLCEQLHECHKLCLIFPEHHQGKRDQEKPEYELAYSQSAIQVCPAFDLISFAHDSRLGQIRF